MQKFRDLELEEIRRTDQGDEEWGVKECWLMRPVSGITRAARIGMYLFCILPKFLVEVIVLVAGSGGVLRSGNNFDLVLNVVAATFLLELDDVVYAVLVPESIRMLCGHLPPLGLSAKESGIKTVRGTCGLLLYSYLFFAAICATCLVLYAGYWCT